MMSLACYSSLIGVVETVDSPGILINLGRWALVGSSNARFISLKAP